MIYFTSDTHYFHKKIIEYCNRPFKSVEEMNETLIANYNMLVKPDDVVYHLGDFAFAKPGQTKEIFYRLNGKKILIHGNHDVDPKYSGRELYRELFHETHDYLELKINGERIVMFHFPIESWNKRHRSAIHVHGHTHATYDERNKNVPNRFDVGVDSWNYFPVSISQILKLKVTGVQPDRYSTRDNEI